MDKTAILCQVHEFYGKYRSCKDLDIAVVIVKKGVKYPICKSHWKKIAKSNLEW